MLCYYYYTTQLIMISALEALRDALYKYSTTTTTTTTSTSPVQLTK